MRGICDGSEKPKIPGPKECESQIMEVKPEGKVEGAEEMKPLEETVQKEKGKCICKIIVILSVLIFFLFYFFIAFMFFF